MPLGYWNPPMPINCLTVCAANLLLPPPDLSPLLQPYGVSPRRLSRISQLTLAGALPLCAALPPHSALYLASPFGSPQRFARMTDKWTQQQQASPLDFTAQLHNAPLFHLAQTARLHGESLFVIAEADSLTHILHLAANALAAQAVPAVLLGWANESRQAGEAEISLWWHLRPAAPTLHPAPLFRPDHTSDFARAAFHLHHSLQQHRALQLPATAARPPLQLQLPPSIPCPNPL